MRALWKGTISFGLVSIPIKLYAATEPQGVGFKLLCKKCQTPVHYKRYCEGCSSVVEMKDTVKGLETSKGHYLTFTQEELDKMKPSKTDRITIKEFVDADEIDLIYYNKFYFCGPQSTSDRAYYLLKEVLATSNKVAIGSFTMREKQYVCGINGFGPGLLLSTLSYAYEVRDINDIKELKNPPELTKDELNLAVKLVDQLYKEEFDIAEFRDTFADQIKEILANGGGAVDDEPKAKKPKKQSEKNLLDVLKASLK